MKKEGQHRSIDVSIATSVGNAQPVQTIMEKTVIWPKRLDVLGPTSLADREP
jgi:hypothetical protein